MATPPDSSGSPAAKADGVAAVASAVSAAAAGGGGGGSVSSPQSRRSLPAPWAQVVRGGEPPESVSVSSPRSPSPSPLSLASGVSPEKISLSEDCGSQKPSPEMPTSGDLTESSDSNNDGNVGRPKKPAWNKPVNGVVEVVSVMGGAVSWPALSESTRSSPKSAADSSKSIPDGSTSVSQGPIITQSPQKQANVNANTNSNANPTAPVRPRSMKYKGSSSGGGGGSGPGGGVFVRTPPPPPPPLPPPFPIMHYGPVLEPPVRGSRPAGGGFPSQPPHGTNDHSPHRNHGRKGNFGGRPRGDGSYHNSHGGRRDQERRDVHMAPQFAPPPPPHAAFLRHPPGTGPFLPPPMRPFVTPMGFDMAPFFYVPPLSPEPYSSVPIISQAPQLPHHLPLVDPNLPPSLINQIEYYFSDANLVKDDFLRSNMDEEGWVTINLIANFPRVKSLTDKVQSDNIQFILYCLRASTFLEVQDEKVRRRDGWRKWTHTSGQHAADSGSSTPVASTDSGLTASLQNVSLNESATNISSATEVTDTQLEVAAGGLSDESTSQSKLVQEEGSADAEEISTNHA